MTNADDAAAGRLAEKIHFVLSHTSRRVPTDDGRHRSEPWSTLAALADASGVSRQTLSKAVNGRLATLSPKTAGKLAAACGLDTPTYFLATDREYENQIETQLQAIPTGHDQSCLQHSQPHEDDEDALLGAVVHRFLRLSARNQRVVANMVRDLDLSQPE